MQVSISSGKDTGAYDYKYPYIKCSSREEFETVTGFHANTNLWTAMTLHECFHGFQFLHKGYLQKAVETGFISAGIGDSLQSLYTSNAFFKRSVDKENAFLLKAIRSTNKDEINQLIRLFFAQRKERRQQMKMVANYDYYIT